eukprot:2652082-Rhodomonas_salina.1
MLYDLEPFHQEATAHEGSAGKLLHLPPRVQNGIRSLTECATVPGKGHGTVYKARNVHGLPDAQKLRRKQERKGCASSLITSHASNPVLSITTVRPVTSRPACCCLTCSFVLPAASTHESSGAPLRVQGLAAQRRVLRVARPALDGRGDEAQGRGEAGQVPRNGHERDAAALLRVLGGAREEEAQGALEVEELGARALLAGVQDHCGHAREQFEAARARAPALVQLVAARRRRALEGRARGPKVGAARDRARALAVLDAGDCDAVRRAAGARGPLQEGALHPRPLRQ